MPFLFLLGQLRIPTRQNCQSEPRFPSWCESWSCQLSTRRLKSPLQPSSLHCPWTHLVFPATALAMETSKPADPTWVPADLSVLLFWSTSFQGENLCTQTWGIPLLLTSRSSRTKIQDCVIQIYEPHSPQENHKHESFGENSPNPALLGWPYRCFRLSFVGGVGRGLLLRITEHRS